MTLLPLCHSVVVGAGRRCLTGVRNMSASAVADKFQLAQRYQGNEENIWVAFSKLALETQPVNLGQGFPDYAAPEHVTKGLATTSASENCLIHQYTRPFGHVRLVNVLSKLYAKVTGRDIDPFSEILVTVGAYESLFCAISGNINPGDEVIVIEPYFDCYQPMIKVAGGVPVFIPLRPTKTSGSVSSGDWKLDSAELESKFNSKTKMIIINTPHNPTGKVFTRSELEEIALLCQKHNVLCVADEVYEWMVYGSNQHVRIATLPGMWERTLTIGSAGKTFSVTGWKLGWTYGPANLIRNLQVAHQNCLYTVSTPLQEALARSFELELAQFDKPECYFVSLARELQAKRDFLAMLLSDVGIIPVIPEGGYFMMADWSQFGNNVTLPTSNGNNKRKDYRFVEWLSRTHKLQGIPPSAFYGVENQHMAENYIRWCFIKEDHVLEKAASILRDLKKSLS